MTRSTEFGATVNQGVRAVQPDIVVHARRCGDSDQVGPKVGLVVAKTVGNSVQRHRVARRLRHVARAVDGLHAQRHPDRGDGQHDEQQDPEGPRDQREVDLDPTDRVVIRALPSSRYAISARLEQQLRVALKRAQLLDGARR